MKGPKRWMMLAALAALLLAIAGSKLYFLLQHNHLEKELGLARAEGLPVDANDLRAEQPPKPQNGAPLVMDAWSLAHGRLLKPYRAFDRAVKLESRLGFLKLNPDELSELRSLQPVIAYLRQAANKPKLTFERHWEEVARLSFDLADLRTDVGLLLADSARRDQLNQTQDAEQEMVDAATLSAHISDEPDIVSAFDSMSCETFVERQLEDWLQTVKLKPKIGERVERVIAAMGPLPNARRALSGELVIQRENIQNLGRRSPQGYWARLRMGSMRFANMSEVRDAYDLRAVEAWRALYRLLPATSDDPARVSRAISSWSKWLAHRTDWSYDYLHVSGSVFGGFGTQLKTQLARRRTLLTLAELVNLKAAGKTFDGTLSPQSNHIDPFSGQPLRVSPNQGGWIVYSLDSEVSDFAKRTGTRIGPDPQNISAEYPRIEPVLRVPQTNVGHRAGVLRMTRLTPFPNP